MQYVAKEWQSKQAETMAFQSNFHIQLNFGWEVFLSNNLERLQIRNYLASILSSAGDWITFSAGIGEMPKRRAILSP